MKSVFRLSPCPSYDLAGWESWLEDMAKEGLTPVKFDNQQPFILFDRTPPREYRYRMEPAQGRELEPDEDFLTLARELGWEYVGRRRRFFLFRTGDPNAPELHTEPETQALALGYLKKQFRKALIFLLAELLILGGLLLPQFGLALVEYGSVYILSLFLLLIVLVSEQSIFLWNIFVLQRQLKAGQPMAHRRDWRRGAKARRAGAAASWLILIFLVWGWLGYQMRELGFGEASLAEYPGQPPFVTLDELSQEAEIDHISNHVFRSWSDPLFPVCIYWLDGGNVTFPDGDWTAGLLQVQYCEARTSWLAKMAAKGYLTANRHRYDAGPEELPQLGLDYAAALSGEFGMTRAVLVEGNTVVCVEFSLGGGAFTLENWLQRMASRLAQ